MARAPQTWSFAAAAIAAVLALSPSFARAADAENGGALARQWCASCHAVAPNAASARDAAPSFSSIARRPDVSDSSLRGWLSAPHPSMPDFQLSRGAIEDLVAYIRSQK